ncbi:MAG TPA: helix-turn-helix transcriptional regulator [Actinokineospora sp.]|jgi:transcriptional regulator with XRE-family HTH domain|nr:helix-turn-helix transcriptional regulator [Actinokineospora sp.]
MSEHRSARARALAKELTDKRKPTGLTTRTAAARLSVSATTLNRIETGRRMPKPEEVSALLAIYGVVGPERKRIMELVEDVRAVGWWHVNRVHGSPMRELVHFESQASAIVNYTLGPIPGLLQTADYARAVLGAFPSARPDLERRLDERLRRQSVLHKLASPRYTAFIDEGTLRRPFGGVDAMAEQVRWLIDMAKRPNIFIRAIPFRRGSYDQSGYFSLFDFREAPPLVFVEGSQMSGFLDEAEDIEGYQAVVESLRRIALDSTESVGFLERILADHERG